MSDLTSPRVNSAQFANFVGRTVRFTGKVKQLSSNGTAIVEGSDGGEVEVKIATSLHVDQTYAEFIGQVVEPGVMKAVGIVNLSDSMDMKVINYVTELWHNPKYASIF